MLTSVSILCVRRNSSTGQCTRSMFRKTYKQPLLLHFMHFMKFAISLGRRGFVQQCPSLLYFRSLGEL